MAARRRFPPAYQGQPIQESGMMRHGSLPGFDPPAGHWSLEPFPPSEQLENRIAAQAAEIEQLTGENHRLAATDVALREELEVAREEVERLKAHIGSIQTESDIQIRVLLDKIAKMEADINAGESVKRDLKLAHLEAQSLVKARQEFTAQIHLASQELQKARADAMALPELLAELDSLRKEHQRLRKTFEYDKRSNMDMVGEMKEMENTLFGMVREVEKLRTEILNAESRARAPNAYGVGYTKSDTPYPPPIYGGCAYADIYGRPLRHTCVRPAGEGMIPYVSSNGATVPVVVDSAAIPAWGSVQPREDHMPPSMNRGEVEKLP